MNCIVCLDDGNTGSVMLFGAPIMHSMSGLSLAWHWHGVWGHVHASSHSGTVDSCGRLLRCPALVFVRNRVCLLACNVCVIICTALLCLAIRRPFKNGCLHVDSRCGHVSLSFLWHSVQLGFGCVRGQNILFL
jgi:hypothetical protein